ncbi:MAG TPA: hypothetical protein VKR32_04510 [Puia sp.]|nr:hypothetical protein [Puia sp.]
MFDVLNSYLYQHKNISIPGLGTIYLETSSAIPNPSTRTIAPPMYHFRFDKYFDAPDKDFFSFLAAEKNIPDYEAIKWYNEFSYDLRSKIRQEEKVQWEGVGMLRKDYAGNIIFEPEPETSLFMKAVPAEPVTRRNVQQRLMVGDKEKTNYEMDEWLQANAEKKRETWWIYALVAASIASLVLLFYYSNNKPQSGFSGNQQKLETTK